MMVSQWNAEVCRRGMESVVVDSSPPNTHSILLCSEIDLCWESHWHISEVLRMEARVELLSWDDDSRSRRTDTANSITAARGAVLLIVAVSVTTPEILVVVAVGVVEEGVTVTTWDTGNST